LPSNTSAYLYFMQIFYLFLFFVSGGFLFQAWFHHIFKLYLIFIVCDFYILRSNLLTFFFEFLISVIICFIEVIILHFWLCFCYYCRFCFFAFFLFDSFISFESFIALYFKILYFKFFLYLWTFISLFWFSLIFLTLPVPLIYFLCSD
jgi:hypothetical protein